MDLEVDYYPTEPDPMNEFGFSEPDMDIGYGFGEPTDGQALFAPAARRSAGTFVASSSNAVTPEDYVDEEVVPYDEEELVPVPTTWPPGYVSADRMRPPIERIKGDERRFREKLARKAAEDPEAIVEDEMIVREKGRVKKLKVPGIQTPKFVFGNKGQGSGGVGSGEGEPGDVIGKEKGDGGDGEAGDDPGQHGQEVFEVDVADVSRILAEKLNIKLSQGRGQVENIFHKVQRNAEVGFRRDLRGTARKVLKAGTAFVDGEFSTEAFAQGLANPDFQRHLRVEYRPIPSADGLVLYMLDASGSMTSEKIKQMRHVAHWGTELLRHKYRQLDFGFIVHDTNAAIVGEIPASQEDAQRALEITASGGTAFAPGYDLALETIKRFPNTSVHFVQLSDGDNFGEDKDPSVAKVGEILNEPNVESFGFARIGGGYSSSHLDRIKQTLAGRPEYREKFRGHISRDNKIWPILEALLDQREKPKNP